METQDYAFQPGLTVGELLKSTEKDIGRMINHRFVLRLFARGQLNKVLKDYLCQDYHFFDALSYPLGACVELTQILEYQSLVLPKHYFLEADEDGYFQKGLLKS